MSNLIQKLDEIAHLNPDEIVNQINKLGWVKLSTMTAAQLDRLKAGPCAFIGQHESGEWWYIREHFEFCFSLSKCHEDWWRTVNAHACLVEDHERGTFPA